MPEKSPPVALTIAGSDCSAGAGIQADLKTFAAFGVHGLSAVTCVVAETPAKVVSISPVDPAVVADQIALLLRTFPVGAIKTGMLFSSKIIACVCDALAEQPRLPPLIVDPVMVASSGDPLLEREAIALFKERLLPLATLVTPNLDETRVLLGREISTEDEMKQAGRELSARFGCAFLVKGGHLPGEEAPDFLVEHETVRRFSAPRVRGLTTHGTGCTFSAAIAAMCAHGKKLPEAVEQAKRFLTATIKHSLQWQQVQALNHQFHPAS